MPNFGGKVAQRLLIGGVPPHNRFRTYDEPSAVGNYVYEQTHDKVTARKPTYADQHWIYDAGAKRSCTDGAGCVKEVMELCGQCAVHDHRPTVRRLNEVILGPWTAFQGVQSGHRLSAS